jgi:hypothetical protein
MGARNRVGIGLSYRTAGLHRLAESILKIFTKTCELYALNPQSIHRVAIADFWRTSHHDVKISPDLSFELQKSRLLKNTSGWRSPYFFV